MKANRKILFSLLVFLILYACTQGPQQIAFEKPIASSADLSSGEIKDSTLLVIATQDNLRRRVGSTSFFVAPDKIATNIHVVADADPVLAHVRGKGTTWAIRGVTAYDVKNDLVILEISGEGTPLPLGDSDTVRRGDAISVMGYSNGRYTIKEGTIYRVRDSDKWLQMDVRISGGNSGSPVIDSKGQVIGIAAIIEDPFGYAIPSNVLKALLDRSGPTEPLSQWCKRGRIRAFIYENQGRNKFFANRYEETIVNFDKSIELNPDNAAIYYNRGLARFKLGDHQAAQGNIEKARGLYETGIADTSQSLKLNPEYTIAYYNRAYGHLLLGESKAAQEDIAAARQHYQDSIADNTQAIKRDPEFTQAYNDRGYVKYLLGKSETAAGNTVQAQKLYKLAVLDSDESIQLDPKNAYAYHTRGLIKAALGDFEGAITDFDSAIRINPESAADYYERGRAKAALGEKEAAEMDFKKAKELDPEKPEE